MRLHVLFLVLLLLTLLTGCQMVQQSAPEVREIAKPAESVAPTPPAVEKSRTADDLLAAGVTLYEQGSYGQAQRLLQSSLSVGLDSRPKQARAYKYLAFIYCVTDCVAPCREAFGNALSADPKFKLTAAEAGHPKWGPVYHSAAGR